MSDEPAATAEPETKAESPTKPGPAPSPKKAASAKFKPKPLSAGQIASQERLKQKQREARERPRTAPPGPGPGSHTPKVERHRAPAFSFGKPKASKPAWAPLEQQEKTTQPGPQTHNPNYNASKHVAASFSFGKGGAKTVDRMASLLVGNGYESVGPGTYTPQIERHRAPAYKIQGRPTEPKLPIQGAGPEAYFKSSYIALGAREDKGKAVSMGDKSKAKSAADLPDAEGAEGAPAGEEGAEGAPAAESTAVTKAPTTGSAGSAENLAGAMDVDWKALSEKLPTGKDAKGKEARKKLWKRADPNGNGYLSSAEVDLMVRDTVGEAMFSAKPVIQSAFHAARQSGGGTQSGLAGDYIERKE